MTSQYQGFHSLHISNVLHLKQNKVHHKLRLMSAISLMPTLAATVTSHPSTMALPGAPPGARLLWCTGKTVLPCLNLRTYHAFSSLQRCATIGPQPDSGGFPPTLWERILRGRNIALNDDSCVSASRLESNSSQGKSSPMPPLLHPSST